VKARIIERTGPTGNVSYVIQQRHFIFRWWWVDAWINSCAGASCMDSFETIEEARARLPLFDGTPWRERDVTADNSDDQPNEGERR
jgi:hypothetical protein